MANFPVFHGITLASNAYIENLHVEILASDPVPVTAGRVWFNSTDKVFRQSTLDSGGAVVVKTFATAEDLAAEVSDLNDKIDALGSAFNYVGTVAGGASEPAAFDLSTLAEGGKDTGDYYKVATAGWFKESAAGTAFYANLNDGLVWNGVGGIDKIDNTNSNVSGTTDYVAVTGSADTGFTVDIDTAFKSRVSTLETDVSTLQTSVSGATGDLANLTTTDKTDLVSAINEVNANVADVRSDFNDLRFTFQSSSAATVHTVTHNLASTFVDFTVLVERGGKYYNDVVSVEETDNNTLKVYLSAAANIKVAVTAMTSL